MKKKVGIFGGSFNPIHEGHLAIIKYFANRPDVFDEVWVMPSPQNPLKLADSNEPVFKRLDDIKNAISEFFTDDQPKLPVVVSEYEIREAKLPAYTCDTLARLQELYPDIEFSLIVGGDFLDTMYQWKNCDWIIKNFSIHMYPRHDAFCEQIMRMSDEEFAEYTTNIGFKNFTLYDAPMIKQSSSKIRYAKNLKERINLAEKQLMANDIEHDPVESFRKGVEWAYTHIDEFMIRTILTASREHGNCADPKTLREIIEEKYL